MSKNTFDLNGKVSKIVVEASASMPFTGGPTPRDFATFDFDLAVKSVPLNYPLYGNKISVVTGNVPDVLAPTFATAGAGAWRMQVCSTPQIPNGLITTNAPDLQFYFYSSISTYALTFYGTEYV